MGSGAHKGRGVKTPLFERGAALQASRACQACRPAWPGPAACRPSRPQWPGWSAGLGVFLRAAARPIPNLEPGPNRPTANSQLPNQPPAKASSLRAYVKIGNLLGTLLLKVGNEKNPTSLQRCRASTAHRRGSIQFISLLCASKERRRAGDGFHWSQHLTRPHPLRLTFPFSRWRGTVRPPSRGGTGRRGQQARYPASSLRADSRTCRCQR